MKYPPALLLLTALAAFGQTPASTPNGQDGRGFRAKAVPDCVAPCRATPVADFKAQAVNTRFVGSEVRFEGHVRIEIGGI
jgi:hypothetical protein